jgi:hypothetical protein
MVFKQAHSIIINNPEQMYDSFLNLWRIGSADLVKLKNRDQQMNPVLYFDSKRTM